MGTTQALEARCGGRHRWGVEWAGGGDDNAEGHNSEHGDKEVAGVLGEK
jgi:hypothetical protein